MAIMRFDKTCPNLGSHCTFPINAEVYGGDKRRQENFKKSKVFSFTTFPFLLVILISLQANTTSSLITGQLSSVKEFNPSKNTYGSEIKITSLNNVYSIDEEFTFFIPEVSVKCECACTDRHELYCTQKTHGYNSDCAYLMNSTTTCTMYNSFGTDTSVCPKYYRMCCQAFFSKNNIFKCYKALHLKYTESILKLQVDLKSSLGKEIIHFQIHQRRKYLKFKSENIVYKFQYFPDRLLPDDWYFVEDGSSELLFSEKVNEIDEINLDKIGWFQFIRMRNELSRVPLMDLKQRLQVKPSNCRTVPPKYEWTLNGDGYYSERISRLPKHIKKVGEMCRKTISKISLNVNERLINVETKELSNVNVSVISVDRLPFVFFSNISITLGNEFFLNLTFIKVKTGTFSIEITNPSWKNLLVFSISVVDATVDHPVTSVHRLPNASHDLYLVCVCQGEHELCELPAVVREKRTTIQEATENLRTTLHFTTDYEEENDTADISKVKAEPRSYRHSTFSRTVKYSLSAAISFIFSAVFIALWLRYRREIQYKEKRRKDQKLIPHEENI